MQGMTSSEPSILVAFDDAESSRDQAGRRRGQRAPSLRRRRLDPVPTRPAFGRSRWIEQSPLRPFEFPRVSQCPSGCGIEARRGGLQANAGRRPTQVDAGWRGRIGRAHGGRDDAGSDQRDRAHACQCRISTRRPSGGRSPMPGEDRRRTNIGVRSAHRSTQPFNGIRTRSTRGRPAVRPRSCNPGRCNVDRPARPSVA